MNAYHVQVLTFALINVIMATSLSLINGITGQFSIGHAGFMGIGAYTAGVLTVVYKLGFWPALAAGSLAAALAGLLVGLPTLRLRGDYLAIATLGFGQIINVAIINIPITGGPRGLTGVPAHTTLPLALAGAAMTYVILHNIIHSAHGRAMLAVREDETAAEAMGVDTTRVKVTAFTIGAGLAGLAGGLFAHRLMFLHPSSFDFIKSIDFLVMVVIGGSGNLAGAAGAAVFLTVLNELLRKAVELRMLLYAGLLILTMLLRPKGLFAGGVRRGRA
ncbi:MAG: branched-chain amino acid ABC transporter permease [Bacillota bacterium]